MANGVETAWAGQFGERHGGAWRSSVRVVCAESKSGLLSGGYMHRTSALNLYIVSKLVSARSLYDLPRLEDFSILLSYPNILDSVYH